MRIGITGSAGRNEDRNIIKPFHYEHVYDFVKRFCEEQKSIPELVSGGAAWIDHVAVGLAKAEKYPLTLHLPCEWDAEQKRYLQLPNPKDTGAIANHYHHAFSLLMTNYQSSNRTLHTIDEAIRNHATITVSNSFQERNIRVADVDCLIAATFGANPGSIVYYAENKPGWDNAGKAGLKKGGTYQTWNVSTAPLKIHISLDPNHLTNTEY